MGVGPKASAANLEPLGKRRTFGGQASSSQDTTYTAPAPNIEHNRYATPAGTGCTTTTNSEPKDKATSTASTRLKNAASGSPIQLPSLPATTRSGTGAGSTEASTAGGSKTDVAASTSRVPSPKTRLETSARALALAQEWQAKFKGSPKVPSTADSRGGTHEGQRPPHPQSNQRLSTHSLAQLPPADGNKFDVQGNAIADDIDEDLPQKRRRKTGPGPQASAANLEPLGKRRRGFSPKSEVHESSVASTTAEQQHSTEQSTQHFSAPLEKPQSGSHAPSESRFAAPELTKQAVGQVPSPHLDRDTTISSSGYLLESKDHGRNTGDRFPSHYKKIDHSINRDDVARKRKRSSSLYRRRDEDYRPASHRDDRVRGDAVRKDRFAGASRDKDEHPRETYSQQVSSVKLYDTPRNDRTRDSARSREGSQYAPYNDRRDRHYRSGETSDRRRHRDDSPRARSPIRSHRRRRDRSGSPRNPYHEERISQDSRADGHRDRDEERRHRGQDERRPREYTERRPRGDYDRREYRHHEVRQPYDDRTHLVRYDDDGSSRHQRSGSPYQHRYYDDPSSHGRYSRSGEATSRRDDRYRTRDAHRR